MAILQIIKAPHPVLEKMARDVREDEFGDALGVHIKDMAETMYAAPGVGLAAPQVADSRRIVVIDPGEGEERGRRYFGFVNPVITVRSEKLIPWTETCLSVPELEVEVMRHYRVEVDWREFDGTPRHGVFEEYEAVIVQHELDHLLGTVILDRASRFKRSRYLKRILKQRKREEASVL
jgi:peptide deformylase